MSEKPENPPAFARTAYPGSSDPHTPYAHHEQDGMTLRDYFAAKALQGVLGADEVTGVFGSQSDFAQGVAKAAYALADAMLAERHRD